MCTIQAAARSALDPQAIQSALLEIVHHTVLQLLRAVATDKKLLVTACSVIVKAFEKFFGQLLQLKSETGIEKEKTTPKHVRSQDGH